MPLQSRQEDGNDQLMQENCDNERESSSGKRPSEDDTELLVLICLSFSPPDGDGRLFIHTFGAIDAFYRLDNPIIEEVLDGKATREMAVIKLLKVDHAVKNIDKFAKAIAESIKNLPHVPLAENSNEMEFCSCFINLLLAGLFDDHNQSIYLRWTNQTILEVKK
ncbi:hypothetical protein G6F62_000980 [Rhizopus arrhizus]|nr:hypothetical protein G6F62_000980 [Rhizopus arrhizus]